MKKTFSFITGVCSLFFALTSLVSCANNNKFTSSNNKQVNYLNTLISKNLFLDAKIQNSKDKKHLVINKNLQEKDLKKVSQNLNGLFQSKLISGGYGEERNFYKAIPGKKTLHLGVDAIVKENTPLFSPADGKIIASYWLNVEGKREDIFANGIGGVLLAKYKIADLFLPEHYKEFIYLKSQERKKVVINKVPKMVFYFEEKYYQPVKEENKDSHPDEPFYQVTEQEYNSFLEEYKTKTSPSEYQDFLKNQEEIVISFIHLSQESPYIFNSNPYKGKYKGKDLTYSFIVDKNISSKKPLEIKKGDKIGYLGGFLDNGYWSPHTHINTYFYFNKRSNFFNSRFLKYQWKGTENNQKTWLNIFRARPLGVKSYSKDAITKKDSLVKKFSGEGYFDPNTIFNLYDDKTEKVYLNFVD